MIRIALRRKISERLIAIALVAVCIGLGFPESHYSNEKKIVKASLPQTEAFAFLSDDVEDADDDYSTDAHILSSELSFQIISPSLQVESCNKNKDVYYHLRSKVFLLNRQLLI